MRSFPVGAAFMLALALSVSSVACGDDSPTRPTPPAETPPSTPAATLTRIELTGPESVPPGGTAQFTATAQMSDGSTQDVTNQASWRAGNSSILTVSATGLVSGRQPGETSVSVSFSGRSATRSPVFVLPAGTYRVIGVVRDTGIPISGAQVTVTGGPALGLSTTANPNYRLYGVSGPTELRVTRNGYEEQKKRLEVTSHQTVDFDLTLSGRRTEISGVYALEVAAAPECAGALPEAARTRTYTASVEQIGPSVTVTLSGATFRTSGSRVLNRFLGTVEVDGQVRFFLADSFYYYYYNYYGSPDVLEQLDAVTYLRIAGSVQATATRASVMGTLNGTIGLSDGRGRHFNNCSSSNHRFVLSR